MGVVQVYLTEYFWRFLTHTHRLTHTIMFNTHHRYCKIFHCHVLAESLCCSALVPNQNCIPKHDRYLFCLVSGGGGERGLGTRLVFVTIHYSFYMPHPGSREQPTLQY